MYVLTVIALCIIIIYELWRGCLHRGIFVHVCCQICLIITKTAETCSRWQMIRIVLRVVFATKINTDTTGWRCQKSFLIADDMFRYFLFCPSPCPYIKKLRQFYSHVYSNVNFTDARNYVMYSHFNQFLVYKCATHVASTKCQYIWSCLFKGPNPAEVGELEMTREHRLLHDSCRKLLHLSVQPGTSFEVLCGQLLRNVGNDISSTRPWCRTLATVVVGAVRARGVMWEVHCAKPEQYI
jgi:hypothetical protein